MRNGDWMQTYTGKQFWPLDPRPEEVCIEDIAHALSNQCRFAGHVQKFYSVAQHSVLVSRAVSKEYELWGLLHDASEAYLVDLPRPVKRYVGGYQLAESRLMAIICERFGLKIGMPYAVREADERALMTEKRDLMPNSPAKWKEQAEPFPYTIVPWTPEIACVTFLQTARTLGL